MIGFDIGGTKCAVSVGEIQNGNLVIENKKIEKWDGKLPQVQGDADPLITIN